MAKTTKTEKTAIKKGVSSFYITGAAQIGEFTFKMNHVYEGSGWCSNEMNLGVNIGDGNTVYCDLAGGFFDSADKENKLYVHGVKKAEDGKKNIDDYDNRFTIDWDDRNDESILETIGDSCFINVGIERDVKDNLFTKKFLSAYDAVAYLKENLKTGDAITVRGKISYSTSADGERVYAKKEIKQIFASRKESDKFVSEFKQTILLDSASVGEKDDEKNVYLIDAYIPEYVGKIKVDGTSIAIKQTILIPKQFELRIDEEKPENTDKLVKRLFKVKSGKMTEMTVEGEFVEGSSVSKVPVEDIPQEIMELVEMGLLTVEEAQTKCAVGNGSREKRMIIRRPAISFVGEGDNKRPVVALDDSKYVEDDKVFITQLVDASDIGGGASETAEGTIVLDDELADLLGDIA